MFTTETRTLFCATGLLLVLSGITLSGQVKEQEVQHTLQQAVTDFEAEEYRAALEGLRALMMNEPGNAMHSYYAGRCLVEMNEGLDEAIELLFGASNRGVPHDVNFYLGMAYFRNYNFTDALRYFGRFELEATRQESKDYNLNHLMATCRSAREITAAYNPFEVMNVTFMDLFDSLQFSQVKMKGGDLQRKPEPFFSDDEERHGLTSLMFIPPGAVRGEYLYFSGYGRGGKNGAQLFRVKKGTARSWGDPEEIKVLNSEGDDVMPYFDPIENDLYFASNGRLGIGGYDLYRAHYDSDRDQWSEPVNLGFPVNSVMDEFLLLPGSDLGMVMFFSNRQGADAPITVYRIHMVEPKKKTVPNDYAMFRQIATLDGAAEDILIELETMSSGDQSPLPSSRVTSRSRLNDSDEPEITPVTILSGRESTPTYQATLSEALSHQARSDSLKDLATHARLRVRESDDPNDRWVWQKQIMLWEKKAHDEEELADALYIRVEAERSVARSAPVNVPESIQVDTVINDLTVYRYTSSAQGMADPETTPEIQPVNEEIQSADPPTRSGMLPSPQPDPAGDPRINRFGIQSRSPYGPENPIPVDLPLPGGTYYRVQVGVFSTEVEPGAFRGINPITAERISERGLVKYYAGEFSVYDDASTALSVIRSEGYEDAFIVAWYNGTPVSTEKAKQLE